LPIAWHVSLSLLYISQSSKCIVCLRQTQKSGRDWLQLVRCFVLGRHCPSCLLSSSTDYGRVLKARMCEVPAGDVGVTFLSRSSLTDVGGRHNSGCRTMHKRVDFKAAGDGSCANGAWRLICRGSRACSTKAARGTAISQLEPKRDDDRGLPVAGEGPAAAPSSLSCGGGEGRCEDESVEMARP
jgi:hypothetical protein